MQEATRHDLLAVVSVVVNLLQASLQLHLIAWALFW